MTELVGADGGQIACEVTGLTVAAEEVVAPPAGASVGPGRRHRGDPTRPSSSWRYRIDPLPGGGSRVRQRFTHRPGASHRVKAIAQR